MKPYLLLIAFFLGLSSPVLAADTPRTQSDLVTNLFQDGQAPASITPQDMRDFIVSTGAGLAIVSATVSAAGTTQGTATLLTTPYNIITTCAADAGVIISTSLLSGNRIAITNQSANPCLVYPPSGGTIVGLTANEGLQLAASATVELKILSSILFSII